MADRDPPALRLRGLAGEPHLLDEGLGDLRPPLVRELGLLRVQRQGAVPHVRVPRAGQAPVLVALGDRHLRAELLPRLIEEPRQRDRVGAVEQLRTLRHPDRLGRAGDQVRVLVLLALALPDQVEQHAVRLAAAGDVRDHRRTPVSCRSCATSSSTSASVCSSRRPSVHLP